VDYGNVVWGGMGCDNNNGMKCRGLHEPLGRLYGCIVIAAGGCIYDLL
jgi:hypothetical protein